MTIELLIAGIIFLAFAYWVWLDMFGKSKKK
jgi:hypothetical protein